MSYKATDWVWRLALPKASAHHVLLCLAHHAQGQADTALAWPSIATIAAETSLNRKTVLAALQWLRSEKLIIPIRDRFGRNGCVTAYVLAVDEPCVRYRAQKRAYPGPKTGLPTMPENGPTTMPKNGTLTGKGTGKGEQGKEHVNAVSRGDDRGKCPASPLFPEDIFS